MRNRHDSIISSESYSLTPPTIQTRPYLYSSPTPPTSFLPSLFSFPHPRNLPPKHHGPSAPHRPHPRLEAQLRLRSRSRRRPLPASAHVEAGPGNPTRNRRSWRNPLYSRNALLFLSHFPRERRRHTAQPLHHGEGPSHVDTWRPRRDRARDLAPRHHLIARRRPVRLRHHPQPPLLRRRLPSRRRRQARDCVLARRYPPLPRVLASAHDQGRAQGALRHRAPPAQPRHDDQPRRRSRAFFARREGRQGRHRGGRHGGGCAGCGMRGRRRGLP